MQSDQLLSEHNVVRYVRPRQIDELGKVLAVTFVLRVDMEPPEEGLSVNWLEYYYNQGLKTTEEQLNAVRRDILIEKLQVNARFAELNVGYVCNYLKTELPEIRVEHAPTDASSTNDGDPSHSEIKGLPLNDKPQQALIGDMMAECVSRLHPAPIQA